MFPIVFARMSAEDPLELPANPRVNLLLEQIKPGRSLRSPKFPRAQDLVQLRPRLPHVS